MPHRARLRRGELRRACGVGRSRPAGRMAGFASGLCSAATRPSVAAFWQAASTGTTVRRATRRGARVDPVLRAGPSAPARRVSTVDLAEASSHEPLPRAAVRRSPSPPRSPRSPPSPRTPRASSSSSSADTSAVPQRAEMRLARVAEDAGLGLVRVAHARHRRRADGAAARDAARRRASRRDAAHRRSRGRVRRARPAPPRAARAERQLHQRPGLPRQRHREHRRVFRVGRHDRLAEHRRRRARHRLPAARGPRRPLPAGLRHDRGPAIVANDGDGRDADARDPGDWIAAGENTGDARRLRRRQQQLARHRGVGNHRVEHATTARGPRASTGWRASCRCACSASAAATTPTSSTAWRGPADSRCPACRPIRIRPRC